MNIDKDLDRLLTSYSESIDFPGKARVWTHVKCEPARKVFSGRKVALVFAVIMLFTTASVFADDLADMLKQISLERLTATQRETLISDFDMSSITSSIVFRPDASVQTPSPEDVASISDWEFFDVYSTVEVSEMLGFVRLPNALPEGFLFESAQLVRYPSGELDQSVALVYTNPENFASPNVVIDETYVGQNGKIDLQTVEQIDSVTIEDIEAIKATHSAYDSHIYMWVKDGIAYRVSAWDDEIARSVAESMIRYSS